MIATSPRDRFDYLHIWYSNQPRTTSPEVPMADPGEPPSRRSRCVRMDSAPSIGQKNNIDIKPVARPLVSSSLSFKSNRAAKLFVLQIASCHTMESRCISLPEEEIANICVEVPHTQLFIHSQQDGISQGFWWGEGGKTHAIITYETGSCTSISSNTVTALLSTLHLVFLGFFFFSTQLLSTKHSTQTLRNISCSIFSEASFFIFFPH